MRLWIGLHLPRLPLEVFCPQWSVDTCVVVLQRERVLALSPAAHAAGVRSGMRRGGVQLLAPEATLHERDSRRETDALHDTAMALLQYSPLLAAAEESTLLIDIGASLRLFGGIRTLCRLIRSSMRTLGFSAALSCAPTARGAWLLAQHGRTQLRTLSMKTLAARLDQLPCSVLPPARPFLDWLEGIGCRTLGDLRRLPRPGLQRRCGKPLLETLDCAHGQAPELFEWIVAPSAFRSRLELFDRIEHAEAILFGAQRLLQQMSGWLVARQCAVTRITLQLEHERRTIPPTLLEIALAEPAWRDQHLVRLLRERLAQMVLGAPVIALCLEATQVEVMRPPTDLLFPEPGGSPGDRRRLMELLIARLGADNVLQPALQADHRPEAANTWVPVQQRVRQGALPLAAPRPCWLLARPIALLMRDHRPFYGSPLRMVSPPERIEAGWWNGDLVARDYFVAEGRDHAYYWVYRERVRSDDILALRWYLHGLFG